MTPTMSLKRRPRVDAAKVASAEYLGSKRSLLAFITTAVTRVPHAHSTVVDLFSGTGVVSGAFKQLGYTVTANDHLAACAAMTGAILLNHEPPAFRGLLRSAILDAPRALPAYRRVLKHLNSLEPVHGFVWSSYSPESLASAGVARKYFTRDNAGRIDAVRQVIEEWRPVLTEGEYALLIADLLRAAGGVSNVAGTYGCYLKDWKPRSLAVLTLQPSTFVGGRRTGHHLFSMDAEDLASRVSASIAYADPPYTKRQYAAYYHVLETIAKNDRPALVGTTGLRDWQVQASEFCYKTRAVRALQRLLDRIDCEHFFLSYNEDGQMDHESIVALLGNYGLASWAETPMRRYRSNALGHKGPYVTERLYHLAMS